MKEIFNSTCQVMIAQVEALLNGEDIDTFRADENTSALFAGALGLVPVRLFVDADIHDQAAYILRREKITPSCDLR